MIVVLLYYVVLSCILFECVVLNFGAYFRYITMMPRMRQALVEFENVDDAVSCVTMCQVNWVFVVFSCFFFIALDLDFIQQSNQIYIMDRPVFFNYSTSQEITRRVFL